MSQFLKRATDFFEKDAYPWFTNEFCSRLPKEIGHGSILATNVLLGGIYLSIMRLVETLQGGGVFWRITPYALKAGAKPIKIADVEQSGRVRDVAIWVDSSAGLAFPTIRISADGARTGAGGNGIQVQPGVVSELGKMPPNQQLFAASDTAINIYVLERG